MEGQKTMVETSVKFTWTINNFYKVNSLEINYLSETFFACSNPWRILLCSDGKNDVTFWLHAENSTNLPDYWNRYASLKLSLINQVDDKMTKTDCLYKDFHKRTVCIEMDIIEFADSKNGFCVNNTCVLVAEVSLNINASCGRELIDFKGLANIEKDYAELLEKACSKHPGLITSLLKRKRSQRFIERGFTALGRVLHFLKIKKVKDMMKDDAACKELQDLWDELVIVGFDDLTWLEPHVTSALSMKAYMVKEEMVTKLKGNVVDLEDRVKRAKRELELAIAEKGSVKKDLNEELGRGIPYLY